MHLRRLVVKRPALPESKRPALSRGPFDTV
jgi:hypothetical protein